MHKAMCIMCKVVLKANKNHLQSHRESANHRNAVSYTTLMNVSVTRYSHCTVYSFLIAFLFISFDIQKLKSTERNKNSLLKIGNIGNAHDSDESNGCEILDASNSTDVSFRMILSYFIKRKRFECEQIYNISWESISEFSDWIQPMYSNPSRAICTLCNVVVEAKESALRQHSTKHGLSLRPSVETIDIGQRDRTVIFHQSYGGSLINVID
jgi:hypothetical protein